MIKAGEIKCVSFINKKDREVLSIPLIKDDTVDNFPNAVCQILKIGRSLDEFDLVYKAYSNISESDMTDDGRYCLVYTNNNGDSDVMYNLTKNIVKLRLKFTKIYGGKNSTDRIALFRMDDLIEFDYIREIYDEAIKQYKRTI